MRLRERLQRAIEMKANEGPRKGGKLPKRPSERELDIIQKQINVIARQAAGQPPLNICYVLGIESYLLHRWDEYTYIALTQTGQLVSVFKPQPKKTGRPSGRTQEVINISATTLGNIDQYFGPLIDLQPAIAS